MKCQLLPSLQMVKENTLVLSTYTQVFLQTSGGSFRPQRFANAQTSGHFRLLSRLHTYKDVEKTLLQPPHICTVTGLLVICNSHGNIPVLCGSLCSWRPPQRFQWCVEVAYLQRDYKTHFGTSMEFADLRRACRLQCVWTDAELCGCCTSHCILQTSAEMKTAGKAL